ncbi:hypothetical protein HDR63_01375 [bacterium]|nr:hypothetical protein [bacterium]
MYTTVKKYQFGVEEEFHINTAILETLRGLNNKTATVIHAYQKTFLVECDLGTRYKLDATQLLYRTRQLVNFDQFKAGAAPKPMYAPNVFLLDTTTGLWDQRYPKYEDDLLDLAMEGPGRHDEAWCVGDMLADINDPDEYVIRGYCRPVPANYPQQGLADMYMWPGDDYDSAQRRFNSAFQISAIQWQNKKANTL